jgi:hypothetical protein
MREELFRRGVVSQADFEQEVKTMAVESQRREGLSNPLGQEDESAWQKRSERIRDFHTDAYFANNLGSTLLEQIIEEVLSDQPIPAHSAELTFNPEIAPWELLFRQGEIYEAMPSPAQEQIKHHLEELKVVLIKRMISDQLPFIGVAKRVFTIADLRWIYRRLIGGGKIGGKAAGMVLAWRILQQRDPNLGPDISRLTGMPDSYFIGSEVIYEFILINRLDRFVNQKYLPLADIRDAYPQVVEAFLTGELPDYVVEQLRELLTQTGNTPFIVRSSSLLEDHFSHSFAGKYNSYFCPNQGSGEENLKDLLEAIRRVYASTFNPDAMLERQKKGLIDYDERMAVVVQKLCGKQYGRYFLPTITGLGLSQNPFCWDAKIRPEEGFLHLIWGFGERAVNHLDNPCTCRVALSHPQLRPETTAAALRHSAQRFVNVIDLKENSLKMLPIEEVLQGDYPDIRYIASLDKGNALTEISLAAPLAPSNQFLLTFQGLTKDWKFVKLMRTALMRLEEAYGTPVEVEFTVDFLPDQYSPNYCLYILECRPL